jgi:hypothetical protein
VPAGASLAHRRAPHQDRELADRAGGQTTKASGAGDFEKGYTRLKRVLQLEAKTTSAKPFSVTRELTANVKDTACPACDVPAIVVEFLGADGRRRADLGAGRSGGRGSGL